MRLRTGSMERMGVRRCELGLGIDMCFPVFGQDSGVHRRTRLSLAQEDCFRRCGLSFLLYFFREIFWFYK